MQKVCFRCGASVARTECHKNRFGEYVCRTCQAAGIKASWSRRLSQMSKTLFRQILLGLAGIGLATLFVWMFYGFLERMTN